MSPKVLFLMNRLLPWTRSSPGDPQGDQGLAAEQMTMVIVTHEMSFARDVADHIIFMDEGVIVEEGPPEEVINNPQNERTRAFLSRFER